MSTEDLTLPHDPNTGFLRGNPAAALQVAQALAQIEALNRSIQGLVDQIQRNAQADASAMPNPAPQPAAASTEAPAEQTVARVNRPSDATNPSPPASTAQPQRPTRDASGQVMGAPASGEDSNTAGAARAEPKDDDSNKGFLESFLEQFQERFEQATSGFAVPDQIDPAVGAFREMTAPLRLLGSMGGSPADKKQFGLAQRTLKFLAAWRKEAKAEQDETQDAIAAAQNGQSRSSLLNGIKIAAMTPRLLALLPAALAAAAATVAAQAGQAIGEKVNDVLGSTETGQKILDGIGSGVAHVAAAFGNEDAKAAIAENLRVEQEQLAQGAGTSRPTTQTVQNGSGGVLGQLIGSGEGDYNSYNQGTAGDSLNKPKIDLSNMTLAELMRRQALPKNHKDRIFAAGKYQTIPSTTKAAVSALKINPNQKFTPELQERIFAEYLTGEKRKSLQAYRAGLSNDETAAGRDLALEFASVALPRGMKTQSGRISDGTMTYYDAKGGNRASITADRALRALRQDRANATRQAAPTIGTASINTPTTQNRLENFKPSQIKAEDTIQPAPKLHLPNNAAGLAEHAEGLDRPAPNTPQQQSRANQRQSHENWYDQHLFKGVGQNVEDRLIAHAVTGGIGWKG